MNFTDDGQAWFFAGGVPWPKTVVFAGYMYRLRMLGATVSRSFKLSLSGVRFYLVPPS